MSGIRQESLCRITTASDCTLAESAERHAVLEAMMDTDRRRGYPFVDGLGADWRPFNRTVARVTEPRLAGGVGRHAATMGPMMQRIQGAFGSSLPRSDGFAIGIAPLVAVLILPRSGLRFGYTTRRRNCRTRKR